MTESNVSPPNFVRLMELLCSTHDVREQKTHWQSLIREENHFALVGEVMQALRKCADICNERILLQQGIIDRLTNVGRDTKTAEDVLQSLLRTRETLTVHLRYWASQ